MRITREIWVLDKQLVGQDRPPVYGTLCFVECDWGLFTRPFVFGGVPVCWRAAAEKLISEVDSGADRLPGKVAEVLAHADAGATPPRFPHCRARSRRRQR